MKEENNERIRKFLAVAELIARYVEGKADENEQKLMQQWHPSEANGSLPAPTRRKQQDADRRIYRNVAERLGFPRRTFRQPARLIALRYAAVAAMVAILFGTSLALYNRYNTAAPQTILADGGQALSRQLLTDGTQVEMAHGSRLTLDGAFNDRRRAVKMQGKIFFEVAKNPDKPFCIDAQGMQITVRGTSFDVMAYPEIGVRQVTVYTGRVEVASGGKPVVLTRGMQLLYNPANGHSELKHVDEANLDAWRSGKLVMVDAPLDELRLRLWQHFGMNLEAESGALPPDARISTSFLFETPTPDKVMARLCALYDVHYRIASNKRIIIYK